MKEQCRHNLELFAEYYFPDLCRLDFNRMHRYLFKRRAEKTELTPPKRRGSIDVVLAPRGAAKSTLVSLVFPIHALLYRLEGYIVLISATQRQAAIRLSNIRDALDASNRLTRCFAEEIGRCDRRSQSSLIVNGVKMDAFSAGSELRGLTYGAFRPTWILLDDVESSARVLNPRYREGLADWMREVVENLGNGYTNIDLIGTLLHPEALPAVLAERPDVLAKTFRSIERESDAPEMWEEWRAILFDLADEGRKEQARDFFESNRTAMLAGAEVLWKEKENYYDLQLMRAVRGRAAFDKEKQNAPLVDTEAVFAVSSLRKFDIVDRVIVVRAGGEDADEQRRVPLDTLQVFGFLDPATGTVSRSGRAGDFSAIATVGIDAHGYLYVLDVWLARTPPSGLPPRVFDLHERWGYAGFGVETNAFQKFLLEPIEEESRRRRAAGKPWSLAIRSVRHRTNKNLRILGLEPLAHSGTLLFSGDLPAEFLNQLADFPLGRHDDGPDALQAAVTLARGSRGRAGPTSGLRPSRGRRMRSY